jgi:hypothetical protein
MAQADALELARDAFDRRAWDEAYGRLSAADRASPLAADDLERLAAASLLVGRDDAALDVWTRAHQEWLRAGDAARAVRCAFRLAQGLLHQGEVARGGGWLARARRLLEDAGLDCVERGYLLVPAALQRSGPASATPTSSPWRGSARAVR